MSILPEELENYLETFCDAEDQILYDLSRETHLKTVHPRMLSGNLQGKLLTMLCQMIKPVNALEVGTFTGYSAICIARGLEKKAMLHTIEINEELEPICKKYFERAGLNNKINFIVGDALQIIPRMDMIFDIVYLDSEKSTYPDLFVLLKDRISKGGYLITDNVLWDGKTGHANGARDKMTQGIIRFNQLIREDKSFEKIVIPIRDGIMLARKN